MIDEKKIEEDAEEQLENLGTYGLDEVELGKEHLVTLYREDDVKAMFKAGVNWFKENLWHDVSEEPEQINKDKEFVECLVQFKSGELNVLLYDPWHHWWVCDIDNEEFLNIATRWLYIEDLMKGGE